jgi:hypothetical protein
MVNYMHVRSSGDPVEITGERDSFAISCDLSEVHSCNHTCCGYSHEYVQTKQFKFIVRILIAWIVQRRQVVWTQKLAHVCAEFLYDSVRRLYCTESSSIRFLYEIVS